MIRRTRLKVFSYLAIAVVLIQCLPLASAEPFTWPGTAPRTVLTGGFTKAPAITTRSYNNARTGANLQETILVTSNVKPATFGKLFSRQVDGDIYAQPLYVPNMMINGALHNVVYVATMHNTLYAFDADDPALSTPLWSRNFGNSVLTPYPGFANRYGAYHDIQKEIGITGTPAIDVSNNRLFLVAATSNITQTSTLITPTIYSNTIYSVNLLNGTDNIASAVITGSVLGIGDGSLGGVLYFDQKQHLQRPGLIYDTKSGNVGIAFGSHADTDPYHGWVFNYFGDTLAKTGTFNVTPDGKNKVSDNCFTTPTNNTESGACIESEGGIWMSGQGMASEDNGNYYFITGNGTFDAYKSPPGNDYGNSFVRLDNRGDQLSLADYFTPHDQAALNTADKDVAAGGSLLIPGTNLLVGGGKSGKLYVINKGLMGQYTGNVTDTNLQTFQAVNGRIFSTPVYWNSAAGGQLYIWGTNDKIKGYKLNATNDGFITTPFASGSTTMGDYIPGGTLSLSANGSITGTGIVWTTDPFGSANATTVTGTLRAYDASNLQELWNSNLNYARDGWGNDNADPNLRGFYAKFNPVTVANGKVYAATFGNKNAVNGNLSGVGNPAYLDVYGLLPTLPTSDDKTGVVTLTTDNMLGNTPGTLSYALNNANNSNRPFSFSLTGSPPYTITLTAPAGQVPFSLPHPQPGVVIDSLTCPNGKPGITIDGSGIPGLTDGLVLDKSVTLKNLAVKRFSGRQIVNNTGGNRLGLCVLATKT